MTTGIAIDIDEKRYAGAPGHTGVTALKGLRAHVPPNEFCALIGPSGCGKSTLLNIIAGIDRNFSGSVRFEGGGTLPRIGYVFQSPRLLPWRTVRENVVLALPCGVDPARADAAVEDVGLAHAAGVYPARLSGGMARRAALARAFAIGPDLLLLDEPFVSLDAAAVDHLHGLLLHLVSKQPATVLFVTHDASEAIRLADRILIISAAPGRVVGEMPIRIPREQRRDRTTLTMLQTEFGRRANICAPAPDTAQLRANTNK